MYNIFYSKKDIETENLIDNSKQIIILTSLQFTTLSVPWTMNNYPMTGAHLPNSINSRL
jgi:hypothetical protein